LSRFLLAIRCFLDVLGSGRLQDSTLARVRPAERKAAPALAAPAPRAERAADGAVQLLAILQRDSRLVDFLMEDIASYSDDQVGAAVRGLHDQCRDSVAPYVKLQPVIDGVEGAFTQTPSSDPNLVKFIGNVPAKPPSGGILRHKGWKASKIELPALAGKQDASVIAPAEIEIE